MARSKRGIGASLGSVVAAATVAAAPGFAADDDARLARLSADDQALAREALAFMARMDEKYFGRVAELNGGAAFEDLRRSTDDTDYEVRVTRGPVVEKAGRMLAVGKKNQPGRGGGEIIWSRFYSLDFHPSTPLVGMLHATIVVQFYEAGTSAAVGWVDVMPGTRVAEDLARLKAITDAHFEKHGRNVTPYRQLMLKGTEDTVSEFRRRPSGSGVSFYGPPVFPGDAARSFRFVSELFDQFTGAYLDQVAQRHGQPVTDEDVLAQQRMRKRWLIDQLFSDPYSSALVPFEVWSFANVPPVIRF